MLYSLSQVSSILNANLVGDGSVMPVALSLDSRTIKRGECFVALRAGRDGHEFAVSAVENGASCLLVDHRLELALPQLVVVDTLVALQTWGRTRLEAIRPMSVFGVTGSVGKTSTKELLAGCTSAWKTPGNRNNTLGLPAALATMPEGLSAAVLEMGMSTPGEIRRLTEIAPLDFGVITNIGVSHLENFHNGQEGIAIAKGELLAGIKSGGSWVFPINDHWCQWIAKQTWASHTKPIPVGNGTDFFVSSVKSLGLKGERFTLNSPMGIFEFEIKLKGCHQVQNAALATSLALVAGFDANEIAHGLATVEPQEGRGRLYPLCGGGWLLDESYNACQESMESCAKALLELDGGEPVAVLATMRELGTSSSSIHEATGKKLRQAGISRLWVFGDFAEELAAGFGAGAMSYKDYESLEIALTELQHGVRILVKGSRYWNPERAVAFLLNRFGDGIRTELNVVERTK